MLKTALLLVFATITASFYKVSSAHSHLANPLPTRRLDCRVGNGRHRDCHGPCPALDVYGKPTGIGPSRPAQTWRRGERRYVTWHRNNHGRGESGFVRLALVPVKKMMDKSAHKKFTFQISCWSSGLHRCHSRNARVCGNDADGKAYKVPITVPTAYPDGVYVFGWAWYGGGNYKGDSYFGDYYSCSFVRIQGGKEASSSTRPLFYPGLNQKYKDSCISATDRVGVCYREPCHGKRVQRMRPRDLPRSIARADLTGARPKYVSNKGSVSIAGATVHDLSSGRRLNVRGHHFSVKLSAFRKGFTISVRVSGNVRKVDFKSHGYRHSEREAPFVINGNYGGRMFPLKCRKGQHIDFQAIATGHSGKTAERQFRIRCA